MSSKKIVSAMVIALSALGMSTAVLAQNTGSKMGTPASPGSGSNLNDSMGAKGTTTDQNSGTTAAPSTGTNGTGGGMGGGMGGSSSGATGGAAGGGAAGGGAGGAGGAGK